jgi:hypothetical protein
MAVARVCGLIPFCWFLRDFPRDHQGLRCTAPAANQCRVGERKDNPYPETLAPGSIVGFVYQSSGKSLGMDGGDG